MNPRPETLSHLRSRADLESAGDEMLALMRELYPICRSISGDGLRQSLSKLAEFIPLKTLDVATGTKVFDWTVPQEWNIRDAYIKIQRPPCDRFQNNNLHLVATARRWPDEAS
jgi:aminopeptidase-like protein